MNDWAREALMKSWPVDNVLVQKLCVYLRGEQKVALWGKTKNTLGYSKAQGMDELTLHSNSIFWLR